MNLNHILSAYQSPRFLNSLLRYFLGPSQFYCDFEEDSSIQDDFNSCVMITDQDLAVDEESWTVTDALSTSMTVDNTLNLGQVILDLGQVMLYQQFTRRRHFLFKY